jgi:hypothetical protein
LPNHPSLRRPHDSITAGPKRGGSSRCPNSPPRVRRGSSGKANRFGHVESDRAAGERDV